MLTSLGWVHFQVLSKYFNRLLEDPWLTWSRRLSLDWSWCPVQIYPSIHMYQNKMKKSQDSCGIPPKFLFVHAYINQYHFDDNNRCKTNLHLKFSWSLPVCVVLGLYVANLPGNNTLGLFISFSCLDINCSLKVWNNSPRIIFIQRSFIIMSLKMF